MTSLDEPPLDRAEVRRRLPTLQLIEDDTLRSDALMLSQHAPAYFWQRAGSTAGYHNAHQHGLWAHTLKLSTVIERLADSYVERGMIRAEDVSRAHAAAILHDQRKAGPGGGDQETDKDHDLQMAAGVREFVADEVVARCVESHMGAWYEGPYPQSNVEELVHMADMMAADQHCDIDIQEPVPDELRGYGYDGVDLR